MHPVPSLRINLLNDQPIRDGEFVLYWMVAYRRLHSNFALQRSVEWARDLKKPLVILEALRSAYPWASDRLHRFVIDGMSANATSLAKQSPAGVLYYPYVEPQPGEGSGLVEALASSSCVIVTDDYPCFFLPRMIRATARKLPVRLEAVDSNGIVPLGAADRSFQMAFHFRRWLQRELPRHLPEDQFPAEEPLKDLRLPGIRKLPRQIGERWPQADLRRLSANGGLGQLPIDHAVAPVVTTGGHVAARTRLRDFVGRKLDQYEDDRNAPDTDGSSGLSPYLHFGHIGAHEVFRAVVAGQDWSPSLVSAKVTGKAKGWWGLRPAAESFLDELITWRELGYIHCRQHHNFDRYDSLPEWSRKTLEKHSNDPRPHVYSLAQLEAAQTHDPLWNAAQRQLLTEGRIHNYMRMLWGKKILEWSESPQEALEVLIELNNKYALDGRDPNSYSGIFWTLGRYDRPWGPERPIFGTVRYMSSESTRRKLDVQGYLNRYSVQFQ